MNRKVKTSIIAIIVIAIVAFLFFGLWKHREEGVSVRIGYLNIVASLPLFVAEEKGFLHEEGVNYETSVIATSNQLVDAVVAGNLDCYIESSAVPVLAVELQSPGKLKVFSVSEITKEAPFDALLVKSNSSIKTLVDLAGKKIGVFPGSTATNLLKKYLTDQKIDVSNITFVPMPPANHLAALVEGSVDVIHAYEPTIAIALSKGDVIKLFGSVYAEMLSPNPQGVAVIGTAFTEKHSDSAKKVVRALERGMIFMKENEDESRQILIKRMNLSEEVAKNCIFLYMLPHDQISESVFQQYADMLAELGEFNGQVDIGGLLYKE